MRKITKAQELIATSRISKAQAKVQAARPYAEEITSVLGALSEAAALQHPLLTERENVRKAGVLVVTSDRGLAGGYNANVLRRAEELMALLREQGKEIELYVVGRKALAYYSFRGRPVAASWTGFSEQPSYANASEITGPLVAAFRAGSEEDDEARARYANDDQQRLAGIDELHIVYTQFKNMLSQEAVANRLAPLEVEYGEAEAANVQYEFEPDADELFLSLTPKYLATRIYAALLEAAASESASRRRAMKAATDNANDLIKALTLEANRARQAQITQEISEIVGGVDALAAAGSDD
ncbi:F-type H+-transporting ATPase subunit gamma [Labedaea rhizosphaerae]|uniref:ATP synthase gamma chain n=2 Tax=Labedaea rhizosphaerae TaxID=598644 RepID=A0A4R6SCA9_LABRH|nr:F-type H+-transporting ATPase subunit gamma [Labedaea rhizosphaerae]